MVEIWTCLGGKRETGDPSVTPAVKAMEEMARGQGSEGSNHVHFRKLEYFLKCSIDSYSQQ